MSDAAPLPDLSTPGRAHFVGAGGVGMAGVALLLKRIPLKIYEGLFIVFYLFLCHLW